MFFIDTVLVKVTRVWYTGGVHAKLNVITRTSITITNIFIPGKVLKSKNARQVLLRVQAVWYFFWWWDLAYLRDLWWKAIQMSYIILKPIWASITLSVTRVIFHIFHTLVSLLEKRDDHVNNFLGCQWVLDHQLESHILTLLPDLTVYQAWISYNDRLIFDLLCKLHYLWVAAAPWLRFHDIQVKYFLRFV